MKRMTALIVALIMLLAWTAACAETTGTRLDLESVKLSLVGSDNKNKVRLHDMTLSIAVGVVEGMPTLQAMLSYGDGQELDSVLQLAGNRLLVCMGGISGTYYIDLDALPGGAQGGLARAALEAAVGTFAANPNLVLDMTLPKNEKGVRTLSVKIPKASYKAFAERIAELLASFQGQEAEAANALLEAADASKRSLKIGVRYNTNNDKLRLRFTRGGEGLQINAKLTLITEPMEFINLSADPEILNLLELDDEARTNLRDELDFLSMKYDFFAKNIHLNRLTGEGEE